MRSIVRSRNWLLGILALLLVALYLLALQPDNLRKNIPVFEWIFFSAFSLYAIACMLVTHSEIKPDILYGIFASTAVMLVILTFSRPSLSDDMYRYIWDGRVQAEGISPYRYPPDAPELAYLRDPHIYPAINRKSVVSVYPPAAEAAFLVFWRILPDNIQWFQTVMAAGGMLAGMLLVGLLRDLGRSPGRVLIFLWSPLLIFETAHAGHVDGLVLPMLVGAWWARVRERDGLTGLLLGVAAAIKLYPALLLPFLWRSKYKKGRWIMPVAFGGTIGAFYLLYFFSSGSQLLGFLPDYFQETFNTSPLVFVLDLILSAFSVNLPGGIAPLALGTLAIAATWSIRHPARDAETALRRCIWPIGIMTLLSQNLFSWYMLWLLPLAAIFLEPSEKQIGILKLPRFDAWTGWWLFCGLVGLSYTFFIRWQLVTLAQLVEFIPLYLFLILSFVNSRWKLSVRSQI